MMDIKNLLDYPIALRLDTGVVLFLPAGPVSFNPVKFELKPSRSVQLAEGKLQIKAQDPETSALVEFVKGLKQNTLYVTTRAIRDLIHNEDVISVTPELGPDKKQVNLPDITGNQIPVYHGVEKYVERSGN